MELAGVFLLVRLRFLFFFDDFSVVLVDSAAGLSVSSSREVSCVVKAERVVLGLEIFTLSLCFLSSHCHLISEATKATVYS